MRKPLQEILNPPELHGEQKKRYWRAVAAWFVVTFGTVLILLTALYFVVIALESRLGEETLQTHETWFLGGLIVFGVLAILLSDQLWGLLFVKSGYLNRAAVMRIRTNRAPTKMGERIHRRISLTLALVIPALLGWLGWYLWSYWVIGGALMLGVWLFYSVWFGWKRAEEVIAGNKPPIPPEFEHITRDLDAHE